MINAQTGNLVIVGANTASIRVFWKGQEVPGVVEVKTHWENGEQQVKLKVNGTADALYMEMISEGGVVVKKGK